MIEQSIAQAYELHRRQRPQEALACLNEALTQRPGDPLGLNTRSMILDSLGQHAAALADVEAALRASPDFPDAINNRGIHHARVGEFERALACYDRSLAIEPAQPHARYNRATACLATGDWLRGFRDFESRWELFPAEAARRNRLKPVWLGERDITGQTLLLHHEQGYGDTLQFCRYAALVLRLGARVIVAVPAALRTLMMTLPGEPLILAEGEPIPGHDYCCSLMSLPHVFSTTPNTVPADIPYLRAEPQAVARWRERLGPTSRLRIGLVWSGRRYPPINYPRDMMLELLEPLLRLDAEFVCLQQQLSDTERAVLGATPTVVRHGDVFADFADTAALVDTLDLVITVDTAIAHLAGALGKPVWLMNRFASCWRWLQRGSDSPWYPSLRQFRQPTPGDWSSVVQEVMGATAQLIANDAAGRSPVAVRRELADTEALVRQLNAALAAHHRGALPEALEGYREVLQSDPLQPEALHLQGIVLAQQGHHAAALASLSLFLRLQPHNAAGHNHYGNALAGLQRTAEALESYDRARQLDPSLADAHYNGGCMLALLERHAEAAHRYEAALALDPSHARAHNNLGSALYELQQCPAALAHQEAALRLDCDFTDARVNAANTLRRLGRCAEALAHTEEALRRQPDRAATHSCHGATLAAMGRCEAALAHYRRALELEPALAEATWNEALALLSRGQLREGFTRYEARWRIRSLHLTRYCGDRAPWLGEESIEGKVILLHAEQGYGDSVQFCRYAPLVAARGARVVLGVPSALRRLMMTLESIEQVVAQDPLPAFDLHCPLLSLPLALGTQLQTIPATVPYLRADPTVRSSWKSRLGHLSGPRVGLVWSGRPSHTNDANRSVALRELLPLAGCELHWVSLQKEIRASDLADVMALPGLYRAGEELTDFADAAALLSELDLLITVDTALAHVAGALGMPVWILLPYVADWRWLQAREDSPWYPSARLFRQPAAGNWASVVQRVTTELQVFLAQSDRASVLSDAPAPRWARRA